MKCSFRFSSSTLMSSLEKHGQFKRVYGLTKYLFVDVLCHQTVSTKLPKFDIGHRQQHLFFQSNNMFKAYLQHFGTVDFSYSRFQIHDECGTNYKK